MHSKRPSQAPAYGTELAAVFLHLLMVLAAQAFNLADGQLQRRYDSLLFSYHFREGFRYVADGYYRDMDYSEYADRRQEELLAAGVDINLAD